MATSPPLSRTRVIYTGLAEASAHERSGSVMNLYRNYLWYRPKTESISIKPMEVERAHLYDLETSILIPALASIRGLMNSDR
ncbi:hypothetical protein M378DRAFT_160011 [Amanita muscaria Koide BX008]|uniref:Uncharacterized protein n=1 Tax=Amanita muscaria (strain Koide BX008) TaxID=946122 RepID=A0A0C2XCE5_AMAMK|nr:hypothetical protein M378DRAFT_160011 [Amanita muscaria Koide BX008]